LRALRRWYLMPHMTRSQQKVFIQTKEKIKNTNPVQLIGGINIGMYGITMCFAWQDEHTPLSDN
jgi:hypothetical protein